LEVVVIKRQPGLELLFLPLALGLGAATLGFGAIYLDRRQPATQLGTVVFLLAAFLVVAAVFAPFITLSMRRAAGRRRELSAREQSEIEEATRRIKNDEALGKLITFNFRLMDRFIDVALGQAKAAYTFCAISASAALLVLLTGTAALIQPGSITSRVTISVLSIAGAALSGFISITFMKTFAMTARQLSYYYGQPLVHCYLLHAEWLANRAAEHATPDAKRFDEALIHATIQASRDAQRHLLDLLEDRPPARENDEAPAPSATGASFNGVSPAR
jgi:hypothetical protein